MLCVNVCVCVQVCDVIPPVRSNEKKCLTMQYYACLLCVYLGVLCAHAYVCVSVCLVRLCGLDSVRLYVDVLCVCVGVGVCRVHLPPSHTHQSITTHTSTQSIDHNSTFTYILKRKKGRE